jgi:3-dehydroquinate dehydratase type I
VPERPKICAVIVSRDIEVPGDVLPHVDFFEVRIDLIGAGWQNVVGKLHHPWLATNRSPAEGGKGEADEKERLSRLVEAVGLGASMVDVELSTKNLKWAMSELQPKATCVVSFHDFNGTLPYPALVEIVNRQIAAGADICKVVTTAVDFADNITMLRLIKAFPQTKMVALAMGPEGTASRILSPIAGGYFTYASLERGKESAPGQLTVAELREIYQMLDKNRK